MLKTCYKVQAGGDSEILYQLIADHTGISQTIAKDIIYKGAVWLVENNRAKTRLKNCDMKIEPGVSINIYYDEALLSKEPPSAECLHDFKQYSAWYKPSGLLVQGTLYGDYFSLQNQAERRISNRRIYVVHRLDYEVSGVLILAHNKKIAAKFCKMFQDHEINKHYRARLAGKLKVDQGSIDLPLDGKYALTEYKVVDFNKHNNTSIVDINLKSGRFHQIRRHFELIGHPIIGDPKYGKGNKNQEGLQLQSVSLEFFCPLERRGKSIQLDEEKIYIK